MERALYIENFRNLGVGESQKLVLNRSLEKGKMGNLIIVIGENNSGKSNVLDALDEFCKQSMQERDITMVDLSPEFRTPKLTLTYKIAEKEFYSYGIDKSQKIYPKHTLPDGQEVNHNRFDKQDIDEFILAVQRVKTQYNISDQNIDALTEKLRKTNEPTSIKEVEEVISSLIQRIDFVTNTRASRFKRYIVDITINNPISNYFLKREQTIQEKATALNSEFSNRFGFNLLPNVYRYSDTQIKTADLSNQHNSNFIIKVLSSIGISVSEIDSVYNSFRNTGSRGILTKEENKLNKLLEKVSKNFNKIYFRNTQSEKDGYRFKFNLESSAIYISLFRGENDISLDYQSAGFKWFFNLYFNLLCSNTLKAGDIIIMDEPATNLHIGGQIELREFLKKFAISNDLTLIVATHSPFLIDLDYLDELRVISLNNGKSYIHNDFTTINENDPDSLKPIKYSLTVSNNILLDPDKKIIFVEGLTDYNYMTAFKKIFAEENIIFLPINGVGNFDSKREDRYVQIIKSLQNIRKHNPILMVDGDSAGKAMRDFSKKKQSELKVFSIDEVDPAFKTIESLYSEADIKKFRLINSDGSFNKSSSISATLKTFGTEGDFSKSTVANFKKLFKFIAEY